DKARAAGGLAVIGLGRHGSARTDRQLIGRAGRQGDPGSSQFLLSADDDLMRDFGGDRLRSLMALMPGDPDAPITSGPLRRAVAASQQAVHDRDAQTRTQTFLFDEVVHAQRRVWFATRRRLL